MDRRDFLSLCGLACLSAATGASVLSGCATARPAASTRQGNELVLPETAFASGSRYRRSVVVPQEGQPPIAVYRMGPGAYSALLMKCSHKGAELNMSGDMLSCPAHGSDFDRQGQVMEGPATQPLIQFPTRLDGGNIYIKIA